MKLLISGNQFSDSYVYEFDVIAVALVVSRDRGWQDGRPCPQGAGGTDIASLP